MHVPLVLNILRHFYIYFFTFVPSDYGANEISMFYITHNDNIETVDFHIFMDNLKMRKYTKFA